MLVMGTVIEAKCSPLDAQTDGVLGEELSPDLPCVRCLDVGGGCTLRPFVPQGCVCAKPRGCSGSAPCQSYPGCRALGPGGSGKEPKPLRPAGNRVPTGGQATSLQGGQPGALGAAALTRPFPPPGTGSAPT